MRSTLFWAGWMGLVWVSPARGDYPFSFRDVGDEAGLYPHVAPISGHAVAWGDVDGDGFPDLYVGTFAAYQGSKPNLFFRNKGGKFRLDEQPVLRVAGRASGAVFADLDNDGNLDLYLSNHAIGPAAPQGTLNFLFKNEGGGKFTDVSAASGTRPKDFRGRSVCVLDFDGDGLLDLLVGECFLQGGQGRSRLFRNLGGLKFADVTKEAGLPEKITGLGVAVGDVNGDGWPDVFLAGREGGNRLLINNGKGRFREVPRTHADFTWEYKGASDDTTCGVSIADVNRDGLADIIIGHHFVGGPWIKPVAVRLYLNRGVQDGWPRFEDVTAAAGLKALPMLAPHVEIQDFDNDGWPDILVSVVTFAGGKPHPLIFKNLGVAGGVPRFREDALAVTDFPTAADRKITGVLDFFDKMLKDQKIMYFPAAASADFDRDGRLDLFLANWWGHRSRSLLLRNESKSGNWLQVQMAGRGKKLPQGVNRMGIGTVISLYPAGKLGQKEALLGRKEISVGYGYCAGQEAIAHFGLGNVEKCDVEILLPHGKGRLERKDIPANQRLVLFP